MVEDARMFCLGRKFRAKRKFLGPEVPGLAGRSGGQKVRVGPEVPEVRNLARTENWGSWIWAKKLEEKPKSEGEKKKYWWKRRVGKLDL